MAHSPSDNQTRLIVKNVSTQFVQPGDSRAEGKSTEVFTHVSISNPFPLGWNELLLENVIFLVLVSACLRFCKI